MNGIMNVSFFFLFFSVVYKPWVAAVAYHPVFPWRSVAPGHVGRFLRLRRPPWYATARRAHGSSHSWNVGKMVNSEGFCLGFHGILWVHHGPGGHSSSHSPAVLESGRLECHSDERSIPMIRNWWQRMHLRMVQLSLGLPFFWMVSHTWTCEASPKC